MKYGSKEYEKYHNKREDLLKEVQAKFRLTIKDKSFTKEQIFVMGFNEGFFARHNTTFTGKVPK